MAGNTNGVAQGCVVVTQEGQVIVYWYCLFRASQEQQDHDATAQNNRFAVVLSSMVQR